MRVTKLSWPDTLALNVEGVALVQFNRVDATFESSCGQNTDCAGSHLLHGWHCNMCMRMFECGYQGNGGGQNNGIHCLEEGGRHVDFVRGLSLAMAHCVADP